MDEEFDDFYYDLDDVCYECGGLGDDYYINDEGELVCACDDCPFSDDWDDKEDE